jgi:hypothetical protein
MNLGLPELLIVLVVIVLTILPVAIILLVVMGQAKKRGPGPAHGAPVSPPPP